MTQHSPRFHGQPVAAAPADAVLSADKWQLVDDLTRAAADYGLSHRTLTVLRTMLTFVPERGLSPLPGRAVVFASNATLSDRLGGMPESTLRRHLSALVSAGVIARCDSPNRKRYARRLAGNLACAYGFDLAPLAVRSREIATRARAAEAHAEEHALLRNAVLIARHALCEALSTRGIDPDSLHDLSPLLARTRLMLRRKNNHAELRDLLSEYETAEMNASDSQIERHQHKENHKDPEEGAQTAPQSASQATPLPSQTPSPLPDDSTERQIPESAMNLLDGFTEYLKFHPQGARSQTELHLQIRHLIPMMGIELHTYDTAEQTMGRNTAMIVTLCLLQRFDTLENPGGYLHHLTRMARSKALNLPRLITTSGAIVS